MKKENDADKIAQMERFSRQVRRTRSKIGHTLTEQVEYLNRKRAIRKRKKKLADKSRFRNRKK